MRRKQLFKKIMIGVSVISLLVMLSGCQKKDDEAEFQKALQAEIDRRVQSGELSYPGNEKVEDNNEEISNEVASWDEEEGNEELMGIDLDGNPVAPDGTNVIQYVEEDGDTGICYKLGGIYPPGEYVAVADSTDREGYIVASIDPEGSIVVTNEFIDTTYVFDTSDAEYIRFEDCRIYPIDKAPKVEKTADGGYPESRYKVGVQIPAGEYVVKGNNVVAEACMDTSDDFEACVAYFHNTKSVIVTVKEGEYAQFSGGNAYSIEMTEDLKPSDGVYKEGMYKVGFHMPAGSYTLKASVDTGYAEIYDGNGEGCKNIDTIKAEPEKTFNVKEGQYVNILGGEVVANLF